MSGFGAIEEGTELADYYIKDTFGRRFAIRGAQLGGLTIGTIVIGGVGLAAYRHTRNKPTKKSKKSKKEK